MAGGSSVSLWRINQQIKGSGRNLHACLIRIFDEIKNTENINKIQRKRRRSHEIQCNVSADQHRSNDSKEPLRSSANGKQLCKHRRKHE